MKNKMIKICIALCGLCLAAGFSACKTTAEDAYQEAYYATYGEWFALPAAESVSVEDASGKEVSVENGKIYVKQGGEYQLTFQQGHKEYKSKLVVNVPAPEIVVEKEMAYVTVGQKAVFPTAKAYDAVGEIEVSAKLYRGNEEIDIENGFTPSEKGTYRYELTASSYGKTTVKNVDIYAETTDAYKNIIASWDKPYGLNQLGYVAENAMSYSTEKKIEGEDGSLRIKASPRYHSQGMIEGMIQNLNNEDVSQYEAIYFYVYNDTDETFKIYWGWSSSTVLVPKSWTLVMLQKSAYTKAIDSLYGTLKDTVSIKNFNGMSLCFLYPNKEIFVTGEQSFYLSSMYGVKKVAAQEVQSQINDVLDDDVFSQKKADIAKVSYDLLSLKDKNTVFGYAELMARMNEYYMSVNGITPVDDKVIYFDQDIGRLQIQELWNSSKYEITAEKTYRGEKVLKITQSGGEWAAKINRPLLYDLSGYKYLSFAVYNGAKETMVLDNKTENQTHGLGEAGIIELPAGQWTIINIPLGSVSDIVDAYLWIRQPDWKAINYEYSLYISPIYASDTPIQAEETSAINTLKAPEQAVLVSRTRYDVWYNKEESV